MTDFKDLNITSDIKFLSGDKIKIFKILNKQIIVCAYRIEESKIYKEKGKADYLHLQFELDNKKYILFTSAIKLINVINKIPKTEFPFNTTIIEKDGMYIFS